MVFYQTIFYLDLLNQSLAQVPLVYFYEENEWTPPMRKGDRQWKP